MDSQHAQNNTRRGRGGRARPAQQERAPQSRDASKGRRGGNTRGRGGQRGRGGSNAPTPPAAPVAAPAAPAPQLAAASVAEVAPVPNSLLTVVPLENPAPPATPVIKLNVQAVVKTAIKNFKLKVSEAVRVKAAHFGPSVEVVNTNGEPPNPHELLAQARRYATFLAMCELVRDGHRVIDSLFGATRDQSLLNYLNGQFSKYGYGDNYIKLNQRHGAVVPLDYGRRPANAEPTPDTATAALLMDVYCYGSPDSPNEINPQWISSLPYDSVIWVGHLFKGFYGAVLTAAWIQRDNGLISWSPDDVNPLYPPHPPCNEMHSSGANGQKAWKIARVVPYRDKVVYNLVKFVASTLVSTPIPMHVNTVVAKVIDIPDFNKMLFDPSSWFHLANGVLINIVNSGVFNPVLPKRKAKFNVGHFQAALAFMLPRQQNGYTYPALLQRVQSLLANDEEWTLVNERFPEFFPGYAEDLALAVFVDRALVRSATLAAVRDSFSCSFRDYSSTLKHINEPRSWGAVLSSAAWVGIPALALTGWRALSQLRRSSRPTIKDLRFVAAAICDAADDSIATSTGERLPKPKLLGPWEEKVATTFDRVIDYLRSWIPEFIPTPGVLWDTMEAGVIATRVVQYGASLEEARKTSSQFMFGSLVSAPIIEEWAKRVVPDGFRPWMCAGIAYMDLVAARPQHLLYCYTVQFAKHYALSCLPMKLAMVAHSAHNAWQMFWNGYNFGHLVADELGLKEIKIGNIGMMQNKWLLLAAPVVAYAVHRTFNTPAPPVEPLNSMLQLTDEINKVGKTHPSVPGREDWVTIAKYPISQAFFPSQEVGEYPIPDPDPSIEVVVHFEPTQVEATDGMYRWFVHPIPLFRPNNSTHNQLKMCEYRLLRDVPMSDDMDWFFLSTLPCLAMSRGLVFGHEGYYLSYEHFCQSARIGAHTWRNCDKKPSDQTDAVVLRLLEKNGARLAILIQARLEPQPKRSAAGLFQVQADLLYDRPYVEYFPTINMSEELWEEWLEHVEGRNVQLYRQAHDQLDASPMSPLDSTVRNIQVNIKRDEVLIKMEKYDDLGQLIDKGPIPRPIHAVDKKPTVVVGPYVYEATNRVKSLLFNYQVGEIKDMPLFWTWGAGRTDLELTLWWDFVVHTQGWHLIVAGDDMLMVQTVLSTCLDHVAELTFIEGDLSQCDHTSRLGCLFAEYNFLKFLGVPLDILALILANARAKLVIGNRNKPSEAIEIFRGYERNTGGTDTTFGNSCTSLIAATFAILISEENRKHRCCNCGYISWKNHTAVVGEFEEAYKRLGLSLKIKVNFAPDRTWLGVDCPLPTFLKGTWYPCDPFYLEGRIMERAWGPLPSRLLKMCKTLNDPRVTMRYPGESQISLEVGLRRFSQALCYGLKDFIWPVGLKRWLVRTSPQEEPKYAKRSDLTDSYILQTMRGSFPYSAASEACYTELAAFYKAPREMVVDFFEKHLQQITFLTYSEHPLWFYLAKDYA